MNFEGIPNRSARIKKWENLVFALFIPLLGLGVALNAMSVLLGILGYALLSQIFIYRLYKKEGRGKEFINRMNVPFAVCLVAFLFFFFKNFL